MLYHSFKPILALTADDLDEEQEYDTENVTLKVVELSPTDLTKQNNWIGENRAAVCKKGESDVESSSGEKELETIPGMELKEESNKKKTKRFHSDQLQTEEIQTEANIKQNHGDQCQI